MLSKARNPFPGAMSWFLILTILATVVLAACTSVPAQPPPAEKKAAQPAEPAAKQEAGKPALPAKQEPAKAPAAAKKEPAKMRIGFVAAVDLITAAGEYLLTRPDLQKENGFEIVEAKPFASATQKYDAFKASAIDADINMGAAPAADLHTAGVPVSMTRAWTVGDALAMVVRSDSPYKDLPDLKGKKFGLTTKSASTYQLAYFAFKSKNMDIEKDLSVVTMPPATLMAALEKGDIEALQLQEPFVYKLVSSGKYRELVRPYKLYEDKFKSPFYQTGTGVRKDFFEKNADAIWGLNKALAGILNDLDKNLDGIADAVSKSKSNYGVTPAEVKGILKSQPVVWIKQDVDDKLIGEIQSFLDRLLEIGGLEKPVKATDMWVKPPK